MPRFETQKTIASESDRKIVLALREALELTFTELLEKTSLSRQVLTNRLDNLIRRNYIEKVYSKRKDSLCYILTTEIIKDAELVGVLFSGTSPIGEFQQKELSKFVREFVERVGVLAAFILAEGIRLQEQRKSVAHRPEHIPEEPYEASERWCKKAIDLYDLLGHLKSELESRKGRSTTSLHKILMENLRALDPEYIDLLIKTMEELPEQLTNVKAQLASYKEQETSR